MEQISLFEVQSIEEPIYTLDPCPKCGELPRMREEVDNRGTRPSLSKYDERSEPTGKHLYSIDCNSCYIPDPGANAFTYNVFFAPEEAAEHWHQRVEAVKENNNVQP